MTQDTNDLPPLPAPAKTAYVDGRAMQGGEYRTLSDSYEPECAMHSPSQMHAYARAAIAADRAKRVAPAGVWRSLLAYAEWAVWKIESEWGTRRTTAQIEADGDMPKEIIQARAALAAQPAAAPVAATSQCANILRKEGKAYPRTCAVCGLGPCRFKGEV